jgi:hypothetical protein
MVNSRPEAPVTETERHRLNGAATRQLPPESRPELNGNGNGGLARESMHAAASSSLSERDMHAAAAGFDAIIEPLEVSAGKPLYGRGRQVCLVGYEENPEGFRLIAEDAQARATRNALGLLVRMVLDGDHRLPPGRLEAIRLGHAKLNGRRAEKVLPPLLCASCGAPRPADAGTKCRCGRPWRESEAVAT